MKSVIELNPESTSVIHAHAQAAFPDECCGFLYGNDGEVRRIVLAKPVDNAKEGDQRRRFEISPLDYLKAERFALENDLQLLGIYHSHPNHPAIASVHDLEKAMPFFSYVIVSVMEGKIADTKSWKLKDAVHEFAEEKVILPQTIKSSEI